MKAARTAISRRSTPSSSSAVSLLSRMNLWLDAEDGSVAGRTLVNRGTGGAALSASLGPQRARVVDGGLRLPGLAGNYASIPDAAALDITGDLELVMRLSLVDWTPAAETTLVSKYHTTANRAYLLQIAAAGFPTFYHSVDGAAAGGFTSSANFSHADGATGWVKLTYTPDDGGGFSRVKFYEAADSATEPVAWTQVGTDRTAAVRAATYDSTAALIVGAYTAGAAGPAYGTVYRAIVRNGIDGTTVADVDFTAQANDTASFVCTTGQTVTVTGTTASTNDPLWLAGGGTAGYAYLPGISGNLFSSLNASVSQITGDLEVAALVALADWTPASVAGIIGRDNGDPNRSFQFLVNTTGGLRLRWFPTGSAASSIIVNSTVSVTATDGNWLWIKATLDVDNGAVGNDVKFYTGPYDGTTTEPTWTQLGTTVTTAGTTSLPTVTANLGCGDVGGNLLAGKVQRTIVRNGIGGSSVWDVIIPTDVTTGGATSFTATSGQLVSVSRATSGRKLVLVPTGSRARYLLGTDDFLEVFTNALVNFGASDDFTVWAVVREFATVPAGSAQPWLMKKSELGVSGGGAALGWALARNATTGVARLFVSDSGGLQLASAALGPAHTIGTLGAIAGVRNTTSDTATAYENGVAGTPVTDSTTATSVNALGIKIGYAASAGVASDGELFACGVARRALTAAELLSIATYYGAV
jgi:hypothetical protein